MITLAIDIETYSDEDLPKTGVYRYSESPVFEVLLFGYAFNDEPRVVVDLTAGEQIPKRVLDALWDPAVLKTAFNANFERICLARHFNRYMPPEQWSCTSVLALTLGLPQHLSAVGDALRLPKDKKKMGVGKSLITFFCKPCKPTKKNGQRTRNLPHHDPERWAVFKEYCGQDVDAERHIRSRLVRFEPLPFEHKLWCLDQKINERGIRLDMQLVEHAIACDAQYQQRLVAEAVEITGLDNPKSVAQLKKWLEVEEDTEIASLNKQTVPELLKNTDSDKVRRVLQLRQEMAKTSVKKYVAMKRAVSADGRVRGLHQFYGANRTGRWAGRIVQPQNLPQNKLKDLALARELLRNGEYETLELVFGNVPDVLSQLIRTAMVASDSARLLVVDFSAIEARVLAWLAWEEWRIRVFNTHGKIYEASAEQMFKLPEGSVTKTSPYRQKGKVAELALGYQGGAGALITMGALKMGLVEDELDPIKIAWRAANKNIEQFWYTVERAALAAVRDKTTVDVKIAGGASKLTFSFEAGCLFLELPSGRRLTYYRARIEHDAKFNKQGLVYEGLDQETKRWTEIRSYGGKLVENITQAIARDCLAEALVALDGMSYGTVMHVHDEAVMEMSEGHGSLEQAEAIMGTPISWAPGLPLRGDGFETIFYKKDD